MRSKQWFANGCLLLAAFLWGSTFVAQAESTVGAFTYLACRSAIGALFLLRSSPCWTPTAKSGVRFRQ